MTTKRRALRLRGRARPPEILRPLGLLADSPSDVARICSAIDRIGASGWTSYGGWSSDVDGVARRGWVQQRPSTMPTFLLQVFAVLGSATADSSNVQRPGGGWLNVEVRAHEDGPGSSLEIRGDLDAGMHESIRRALRHLGMTVVRTWDPTVP
ncbi:MAG TPA: hypothetical protein VGQ31_04955 [Candidatus Limnocylindrales bacterium]|jgi:hypothetical protein|nr:hypothetical protein [Candidatus Limnocylindrales bacterium]